MYKLIHSLAMLGALTVSSVASAAIDGTWSEDFETCPATDLDALGNITGSATCTAGFQVFGAGFDASGGFLYNYGNGAPFPAPNNNPLADPSASISGVATAEGGAAQGANQLNFFNDYNNLNHTDGSNNIIKISFFREWTVDASDVGKTYVFRFSYKKKNDAFALAFPSTGQAYIKTLDPLAGFNTTNEIVHDVSSAPTTWTEDIEISLSIDAGLVGQIFQVGVENTAQNSSPSGIIYDNFSLFAAGADADGDGVLDSTDNCTTDANPGQQDGDADGHGNACDADFDQSCFVNFNDLTLMRQGFFTANANLDLDSSGFVNFNDLTILRQKFFQAPGPSPVGSLCNP